MHKPVTLTLPDSTATEALAARLAARTRRGDAIPLEGPLGAGKSTFARAFLRAASADPALEVPSPTFTLVQGYDLPIGPAFHFDLWRLDGAADLAELGWEEARDGIVLVEWPDRLGALRPADALTIALAPGADDDRRVATLTGSHGRLAGLAWGTAPTISWPGTASRRRGRTRCPPTRRSGAMCGCRAARARRC